jgi:uncharacterized protein YdhG (YjbR/CyaY superfamily)
MQSQARTVDAYLAEVPPTRRPALATLRKLIRKIAPAAEETMRYGLPTYLLGDMFCALASQKHYMALYCREEVVDRYRSRLDALSCGKSCIRFRQLEDLPMTVISSILREAARLHTGRTE